MTKEEQIAVIGKLVHEYKDTCEKIACLTSQIRDAAKTLGDIGDLLGKSEQEARVLAMISNANIERLSSSSKWLAELASELNRKKDLKNRLDAAGYGNIIQE